MEEEKGQHRRTQILIPTIIQRIPLRTRNLNVSRRPSHLQEQEEYLLLQPPPTTRSHPRRRRRQPKLVTDPALAAGVLPTPFRGPDISTGIPFPTPGFSSPAVPTCSPAVVVAGGGITTSFLRLKSQTVSRPSTSLISNAPYVEGISRTNKS